MNDNPRFPHDPTGANPSDADDQEHADDQQLGAALGDAISRRVENPVSTPPTSLIARRAAAQARARAARRTVVGIAASLALVAGGIVAWQNYDGDQGGGEVMVTAPTPAEDPSNLPEPSAASPAAPGSSGSDKKDSLSQASGSTGAQTSYTNPTPEELSTGPVLQWTEIDPPPELADNTLIASDGFRSIGDGRILARNWDQEGRARFYVTTDGTHWTEVPTPAGISPQNIDISGTRWLVTGWNTNNFDGFQRIFFSGDQGASWTELDTSHLFEAWESSRPIPENTDIRMVLTSGQNLVVVLQNLVFDEQTIESLNGEPPRPPVWILASDGGPLEIVAEYTGWISTGFSGTNGFSLRLIENLEQHTLDSADGGHWTRTTSKRPWINDIAPGPGGSIWATGFAGNGTTILRLAPGETPVTAATVDNLEFDFSLSAGPSGLATTASPSVTLAAGDDSPERLPLARITKDGYQLRYNEPEGGITLWDMAADAPVNVFGPDVIQGVTLPEGVRAPYEDAEIGPSDMDAEVLVFFDPETGTDLVAFTVQDLMAITMADEDPEAMEDIQPEVWVGWSANGTDWGWQSASAAFGIPNDIDDRNTWIELAVGDGFVLARVNSFASVGSSLESPPSLPTPDPPPPAPRTNYTVGDDYAGGMSLDPRVSRWFIARVP